MLQQWCVLRPVRCVTMRLRPGCTPTQLMELRVHPRHPSWIGEGKCGTERVMDKKGTEGEVKGKGNGI